jgi:Domain of unknown function DUF1828/Domain of unknown function DUF1829
MVDTYLDWLRSGLSVESVGESCELTTPFLDRHNDHLQVYATRKNGAVTLTDDGYILSDIRTSGLDLNTPKRKTVIDEIVAGLGVKREGNQLVAEASEKNFGQRLHSLIQAMLAVNDMFVMAQPHVATFFWEDVKNYLDQNDVRYSARVKLAGLSGYDHGIDFLIPRSKNRPERVVQAINAPNKNTIGSYLFALTDTRAARQSGAEAYAFLNDGESKIGGEVFEALEAYEVKAVPWTLRDRHLQSLAG